MVRNVVAPPDKLLSKPGYLAESLFNLDTSPQPDKLLCKLELVLLAVYGLETGFQSRFFGFRIRIQPNKLLAKPAPKPDKLIPKLAPKPD